MSTQSTGSQAPAHERAAQIEAVLNNTYGAPFVYFSRKDPLSELISALLSHRTKNRVSRQAYHDLREAYPNWEALIDAPVAEVERLIAPVTFPEVKSPRIQSALATIRERTGKLSLGFLGEISVPEARAWLESISGVGAKTSAAVLNFSLLRMPALVVDTHHHRVAQRTGIVPPKASLDKTARLLQSYLPHDYDGQQVYDAHQAYMRHGQKVCFWRDPNCGGCVIRDLCDYGKARS